MDYEKLTKAELIEQLKNAKHLATTIQAKESEILKLKVKFKKEIQEAVERENEAKQKINELVQKNQGTVSQEVLQSTIEKIEMDRDRAIGVANRYMQAFRDYLKLTQQTLNMAISTEELISPKKIT